MPISWMKTFYPCDLFCNCRPDLAVFDANSIHILKLTVCHETNMVTSNDYKKNKYKNVSLCGSAVAANRKIASHFIGSVYSWFYFELS